MHPAPSPTPVSPMRIPDRPERESEQPLQAVLDWLAGQVERLSTRGSAWAQGLAASLLEDLPGAAQRGALPLVWAAQGRERADVGPVIVLVESRSVRRRGRQPPR